MRSTFWKTGRRLSVFAFLATAAAGLSASSLPPGFTETKFSGIASPTAIAVANDGRAFVAQQGGQLRVIKNGALLSTPFLTLTVDSTNERGLIGVVLDPNFASNQYLYVYYTVPGSPSTGPSCGTPGGVHNRLSRFKANGDVVLAGSETILLDLEPLVHSNHNGGALHFGSDGKLYVAVGNDACNANSQDLSNLEGKILRLNSDGTIPNDNPFFATQAGIARAVWAYGLRNPFTFALQPGTGKLHINDVGQNTWEEIDVGAAGANYGWPNSEGPDNVGAGITGPLFTYKHSAANPPGSGPGGFFTGFAIAGGAFYPAAGAFPAGYRDQYYFADFVSQFVGRYDLANDAAYAFASLSGAPVDMLVGLDGALYVLTRGSVTRISSP